MDRKLKSLKLTAIDIREDIIKMLAESKSGHPGGSLSAVEILTALYFGGVMRHNAKNPEWADRDRFVLSKGHAAPVLYAALARSGYIDSSLLSSLRKLNSPLQGHPDKRKLNFLETSTGSLGQGISFGIGLALAAKADQKDYHSFVLVGDGEINEGQIWESAMYAGFHKLDNLTVILDMNGYQLDEANSVLMDLEPIADKWKSFGWNVIDVDGHDMEKVLMALKNAKNYQGAPTIVIARTVKGKGVSYMENNNKYHGVAPSSEELKISLKEFAAARAEL
jgi:transketolase